MLVAGVLAEILELKAVLIWDSRQRQRQFYPTTCLGFSALFQLGRRDGRAENSFLIPMSGQVGDCIMVQVFQLYYSRADDFAGCCFCLGLLWALGYQAVVETWLTSVSHIFSWPDSCMTPRTDQSW